MHAKTAKEKAFDRPPFRDAVVEILENNPGCYMSSVYDALVERCVDTGEFEALPGNEQTLRSFEFEFALLSLTYRFPDMVSGERIGGPKCQRSIRRSSRSKQSRCT